MDRKTGRTCNLAEVYTGCRWLRESGAADEALGELVQAGYGQWDLSPRGERGQPTRRFGLAACVSVSSNGAALPNNCDTADADSLDVTDPSTSRDGMREGT